MGNAKVIFGNETLIDLTGDTVSANNLLSGATAHDRSGTQIVGTVTVPDTLDDLTDVTITSATNGQALVYDGSKWVNGNGGGGGASALDDLTDVDITTPTDGNLLQYNATSQKWENSDTIPDELTAMQEAGAVNILPISFTSQVINHVTFTVNSDGTITANGTASADVQIEIGRLTGAMTKDLKCSLTTVSQSGVLGLCQTVTTGGTLTNYWTPAGDSVTIPQTVDIDRIGVWIIIHNGTTVSNYTFKPMLYDARLVNPPYQPYAMTNRELTDNVNGLYSYVAKTFTPEAAITTVFKTGTYATRFNYNHKTNTVFVAVSGNLNASADSPLAAGIYHIGSVDTDNMWAPTYARMGFYATRDFCATNEPFWVNNNLNKPQLRIESTSPGTSSRVFVYIPQTISSAQWVQCYFSTTVMY